MENFSVDATEVIKFYFAFDSKSILSSAVAAVWSSLHYCEPVGINNSHTPPVFYLKSDGIYELQPDEKFYMSYENYINRDNHLNAYSYHLLQMIYTTEIPEHQNDIGVTAEKCHAFLKACCRQRMSLSIFLGSILNSVNYYENIEQLTLVGEYLQTEYKPQPESLDIEGIIVNSYCYHNADIMYLILDYVTELSNGIIGWYVGNNMLYVTVACDDPERLIGICDNVEIKYKMEIRKKSKLWVEYEKPLIKSSLDYFTN